MSDPIEIEFNDWLAEAVKSGYRFSNEALKIVRIAYRAGAVRSANKMAEAFRPAFEIAVEISNMSLDKFRDPNAVRDLKARSRDFANPIIERLQKRQ